MKKLLFVPSLVLLGIVVGCTTQLVDSSGKPVYDASGKAVMVSSSTKEKTEKSAVVVRDAVRKEIETALKSATTAAAAAKAAESAGLPDSQVKAIAGADASPEELAALKAIADAEAEKYRKEVVYPAQVEAKKKAIDAAIAKFLSESKFRQASDYLVNLNKTGIKEIDDPVSQYAEEVNKTIVAPAFAENIIAKIRPYVEKKVQEGDYEGAREALWRAPLSVGDNTLVAGMVRESFIDLLRTKVNPAEWAVIEKEIKGKVAEFEKEKQFDEAIAWLKAYRRVRAHSLQLDAKLKTVEAELVKLGVKEDNMAPIMSATGKLVSEAERIVDMTDVTTNAVTTTEGKEIAGIDPDLKAYEERLEEYRKTLIKYDCTEAAAKAIVEKFRRDVGPLLAPLSRPASKAAGSTETKAFLQLGTGGLNARISKLIAALVADMEAKKAAHLAALREAAIKAAIDNLTAKVKQLVADGEFAKAREAIWEATSTEDIDMNNHVRKVGIELMLKLVNPTHWAAIEKEFADKAKETKENSSYDEAIAWVEAYPDIRTYTEAIDAKLDVVKDELAKIGIAADKVQPVVDETQKATIEVERLVSHVDEVKKSVTKGEKKLPLDEYEKLLAEYRTALVRNDCTEENADKLVANFKAKIEPYIAILTGGTEKSELLLGSNAINDRLAKLRAKTVDMFKSQKYRHVFTDLIAKVSEAVAEGRYSEARNVVRDVELVQDAEWDARIYATRIGLLNSVVNPNQCAALLKEIDAKAKELFDAKQYEAFVEYAKNYEYVHDTYQQIIDALAQVKSAMVGLTIAEKDAGEYIDKLTARIRVWMEKRTGTYTAETDKDLEELEKALAELEKGIVAQYYRPEEVKEFCKTVKNEILALIAKTPDPITTWELNEALKARLDSYLGKVAGLIAKRDAAAAAAKYGKLLADIDAEVSFESQITMAEDAISHQLGVVCPCAAFEMNAVMGDYARIMRLLKRGDKVSEVEATTILVGAVYLNQPAMFKRALELGAKIDSPAARDPRKRPAMLVAIQTGHPSFLAPINEAKGDQKVVDANGNTALHYAMRSGNLSVVKAIFSQVDPKAVNAKGETALFSALRRNQAGAAKFLIELFKGKDDEQTAATRKAFVCLKNADGKDAFTVACESNARDVLDVLASAGAEYGTANLIEAARANRVTIAEWLVEHGADVNAEGVMAAAFGSPDADDTATYKYLVREGGVALKRTPKCCKEIRAKLADAEKALAAAEAEKANAEKSKKVSGSITFEASESK